MCIRLCAFNFAALQNDVDRDMIALLVLLRLPAAVVCRTTARYSLLRQFVHAGVDTYMPAPCATCPNG